MRKAGLAVAMAEPEARTKTEDREGLVGWNCVEIGRLSVGGGYGVTQRVKSEDAEDVESLAVMVISGLPSSLAEGVP
jgi:hypothetical protein